MARIIEYELAGNGWADAAITLDNQRIELDASYIFDTFGDMSNGLLAICEGQPSAAWLYYHEPRSTRVTLDRDGDRTIMTVKTYSDLQFMDPPLGAEGRLVGAKGQLICQSSVRLRTLVADVVTAGTRMLDALGEDGYRAAWGGHPFPTSTIEMLKRLRREGRLPPE